jgi:hypothetical protein
MPVKYTFKYAWPDGVTPMTLEQWVNSLTTEEQTEYREADVRQKAFRSDVINDGKMKLDGSTAYVWKDKEAAEVNKPVDPTWLIFWNRYLAETQTIFSTEITEI